MPIIITALDSILYYTQITTTSSIVVSAVDSKKSSWLSHDCTSAMATMRGHMSK